MPSPRGRLRRPWTVALAVAIPLALAYLIAAPPAADLAAATYRSDLFARVGLTTWDTGWYAAHGHWLPGYSLLAPGLGALLGARLLLALSVLAASVLFALVAKHAFGERSARVAAGWFALGLCVELLSGRVPYDLGLAVGLGAILASMRGKLPLALALAVLTSLASPVAGAFLALAGIAHAAAGGRAANARGSRTGDARAGARSGRAKLRRARPKRTTPVEATRTRALYAGSALAAAALAPIVVLAVAYPEGGYEPFAASAFWPALAGVAAIALLLPQGSLTPRGHQVVRAGAGLYALALVAAYAIHTPMGGNAARLGPVLAAPLLAGVLWERDASGAIDGRPGARRARHPRALLAALALPLLYWQLVTPIRDYAQIAGDPSVHAAYYAPLLAELRRLDRGRPAIVEVPMTRAHWEAAYLPGHDGVSLARGWERQLDLRYASLFYRPALTPSAYRAWLTENRVSYVALPDAPLDRAGRLEAALIAPPGHAGAALAGSTERAARLPYLRELWRSRHWRLYRFMG